MSRRAYIADMSAAFMTAEELERLNLPNKRTELVRGRLIVREPAGFRHGIVAANVGRRLHDFAEANHLGVVVAAETGFTLARNPDTVRAPDCGFVANARIPQPIPKGYFPAGPDLAVEVLSPDDRPHEVLDKIADWLGSGTHIVWIIDPDKRVGRVYRADGSELLLQEGDAFDGENVLPDLSLPLRTLL